MYLKSKGIDLRKPFIDEFLKATEYDDKLVFITFDVGFSFLEPVEKALGNRYLNLGITEPSGMVTAAALGMEGFRVYAYSMIPFMTFRVHEQVRNGVDFHKANVKILGVEGSSKYSFLGRSHNLLTPSEDVDTMSPYMNCFTPKTEIEAQDVFRKTYLSDRAAYIRL